MREWLSSKNTECQQQRTLFYSNYVLNVNVICSGALGCERKEEHYHILSLKIITFVQNNIEIYSRIFFMLWKRIRSEKLIRSVRWFGSVSFSSLLSSFHSQCNKNNNKKRNFLRIIFAHLYVITSKITNNNVKWILLLSIFCDVCLCMNVRDSGGKVSQLPS